ncbi:SPW repeat protein [Spirosoma sp. KUDC1026]|uniref:SPW repeat protein n=1 Tax=Spirosoma sp. KUDC1026 TaxID=2745947 RepID=UPI00159BDB06|nr:SPW repeat protein [Spirosoma sp. KUDC1026]QKZ11317.1 SPW repeat protein [Spirosoma sp. KUDC1026]
MSIGIWLMASPAVFQLLKPIASNEHIMGPIIASIAMIAISESMRDFRYLNVLAGVWLLIAPWVLGNENTRSILNEMGMGTLVVIMALLGGLRTDEFGGGWQSLFADKPKHEQDASRLT